MRCIVTGAAGFIGSRLAKRLLDRGDEVTGLDCFTDYYPRWIKEKNIEELRQLEAFRFLEADLVEADLAPILEGVTVCYHLAAQAGVRRSWGKDFSIYSRDNVLATQKLLEASVQTGLKRLVFASSSSVYGDASLPFHEDTRCLPVSPYGLTKLACEHLTRLYNQQFGVGVVGLRYFTVYGPGQRPDMAFHRFICSVLKGDPIKVYGDGSQTRDFTFVNDAVEATIRAGELERDINGRILNIAGGSVIKLNEAIGVLGRQIGKEPRIERTGVQRGDALHTAADITAAKDLLGYNPKWGIEEGLKAEIAWIKELYSQ